eukprot:350509-Rhodomonas_salina.2
MCGTKLAYAPTTSVTLNGADYTEISTLHAWYQQRGSLHLILRGRAALVLFPTDFLVLMYDIALRGCDPPYLLPAPVPLGVELLPSFSQLLFKFDVATDSAGTGGDPDCAWYSYIPPSISATVLLSHVRYYDSVD